MRMNYAGRMCTGLGSNEIHVMKSHDQEVIKRYCILVKLQKKKMQLEK